jgi:hypothetical protein
MYDLQGSQVYLSVRQHLLGNSNQQDTIPVHKSFRREDSNIPEYRACNQRLTCAWMLMSLSLKGMQSAQQILPGNNDLLGTHY